MLRALAETEIEGVATTIPAHLAILEHPDFINAEHSTKWVEERLEIPDGRVEGGPPPEGKVAREVDVEVDGRRYQVKVFVPESAEGAAAAPAARKVTRPQPGHAGGHGGAAGSNNVTVPMQGTIVKVLVEVGDPVEVGQPVCVLEAMKMENNINAEMVGKIAEIKVKPGDTVGAGDTVVVIGEA
jgi:acetyl-CoA/propionyl-CoA carboxylase biotin carboxyl carrier protein